MTNDSLGARVPLAHRSISTPEALADTSEDEGSQWKVSNLEKAQPFGKV